METKTIDVIPLFPSPLGIFNVEEDCSGLKKIITNYEFVRADESSSDKSYITTDLNILENFSKEKDIIIKYFNIYKNELFKLEDQNFQMTTSWGTKTEPEGYSQFHNHQNCVYSGVFYFDEIPGGNLEFESYGIYPRQIILNDPTEWGVFNSRSWILPAKQNLLVFFPSYLYHRITKNTSSKSRYSLSFNFFPIGSFGVNDSSITVYL